MKLNKMSRATLASILSLAAISVTACSRDYVLGYLYVPTTVPLAGGSTSGGVSSFAIDFQSGTLTPQADSPIPAGDTPVAIAASPNNLTLYVVNQRDSNVMVYQIGTDGKLFNQQTINVVGSTPTAIAVDAAGTFVYVTSTFQLGPGGQQLYSPASPGPGSITIFPVKSDGTLDTPKLPVLVGNNPAGIVVSKPQLNQTPTGYVYVIDQETKADGTPVGTVLGFSENLSTGDLTPVPGTTITTPNGGKTVATGFGAGTTPAAIAEDPSARFVYITDQASNQVYAYLTATGGALVPIPTGPFSTGIFPQGVTVDPRGKFVYVANASSATVSSFAINSSSGSLTATAPPTGATDTNPTCVAVDPALGIYLYTSNSLAADVSAMQLDANTGATKQVQNTPFPTSGLPRCAVAVSNGSHATQVINP